MRVLAVFFLLIFFPSNTFASNQQAWIVDVSSANKLVRIETISVKMTIDFLVEHNNEAWHFRDRIGSLVKTEFSCVKIFPMPGAASCDFKSPYILKVRGQAVRVIRWKLQGGASRILVHHGPGPGDGERPQGLALDIRYQNGSSIFFELRVVDPKKMKPISKLRRGSTRKIKFLIKEDEPYKAYVNGVEMDILAVQLSD